MQKRRSIQLQKMPDAVYVIRFLAIRNTWVTYNDFVRVLHAIKVDGKPQNIVLDFSNLTGSVYSPSATSISGVVDFYREQFGWSFSFAVSSPSSYLGRTALNHPLSVAKDKDSLLSNLFDRVIRFDTHEEATFVSNAIVRRLYKTVECVEGVLEGLSWCMNEILENIFIHSGSHHGYIMVQIHNRKKVINVSVFDTGCGLYHSLAKSVLFRPKDEMDAIKSATGKGVTESKEIGQGNGLYGLANIVKENHGHLTISSGHCLVDYNYEDGTVAERAKMPILSKEHPGTRIDFTIHYQQKTDVIKALDGYKPYEILEQDIEKLELDDGSVLFKVLEHAKEDVGSRSSGKSLRIELLNLAASTSKTIFLDFSGIHIVTSSFADELLGKTVKRIGFSRFNSRFRILNANGFVAAILDRSIAIRQRELFL